MAISAAKAELLREWAGKRGYVVAWGDGAILDEIRREMGRRAELGEFDGEFWAQTLEPAFKYGERSHIADVRTVVLVAVPRPAHLVRFQAGSWSTEAILPPTYVWYERVQQDIFADLRAILGPGPCLTPLQTPLKAVAVRLGLAAYGRNKLAYVPGLGSYHQLVGFATDASLGPGPTAGRDTPALCPECTHCTACREACPAGAIGEDRILLHAERCLTLANEMEGPWPAWLFPAAHHCLVGCMRCQEVCPQNVGLLHWETVTEVFSPEETATILGEGAVAEEGRDRVDVRWEQVKAKVASIGLPGYEVIIGRNLRALLRAPLESLSEMEKARRILQAVNPPA